MSIVPINKLLARQLAIIMASLATGCGHLSARDDAPVEIRYIAPDRQAYYSFSGNNAEGGSIEPRVPRGEQKIVQVDNSIGFALYNCSSADYRCAGSWVGYFAVPKNQLFSNSTYEVAGVAFKVEKCLRNAEDVCQVALISADCQQMKRLDKCTADYVYFLYNEDFGVTAFGLSNVRGETIDQEIEISAQYLLSGDVGLLMPSLGIGIPIDDIHNYRAGRKSGEAIPTQDPVPGRTEQQLPGGQWQQQDDVQLRTRQ